MESLITGFTYVPHGHMTIHRGNSLQSIIHLIHMYRRNVFLSTRLLFILTVMFEPSLITGLASTTEGYSASIMCSTLVMGNHNAFLNLYIFLHQIILYTHSISSCTDFHSLKSSSTIVYLRTFSMDFKCSLIATVSFSLSI